MAYTARTLIIRAFFLSGLVAKDFEEVSGAQIEEGLMLLNSLLSFKSADVRLIPYFTIQQQITLVPGQESYFVPNLVSVEDLTFNINTVRFSMRPLSRKEYFGSPRVDNINSLPFTYRVERKLGGATVYVYFLPASNYLMKLTGKFSIQVVTLDQDLSLTMDLFFIDYLRYALANYICDENTVTFAASKSRTLSEMESTIIDTSPYDLHSVIESGMQEGPILNWGYVNFPGWTP